MTIENTTGREHAAVLSKAPLVGRMAEREAIAAALRRAIETSRPQLLTVIGTRGVGKSRLVTEVAADLAATTPDVRVFRGQCRPESEQGALAKMLRTRLGLIDGMDADAQMDEMRTKLTEMFGDRRVGEILHFLGAFLGLKSGGTPLADAVDEDPRAFSQVSRAVLRRFFEVDAQRSPLMLVFEDLQDAQPEGIRLLRQLVEPMNAPVVILVTARPDLLATVRDWPEFLGERHTRIDLGGLSPEESHVLVKTLLSRAGRIPNELIDAAVDMGGGNPLLLEQLCRIFYDQKVLVVGENGSPQVFLDRLDDISLPMSVEDAVRSRLSSLSPPERELLEMGAVMGPVFWLGGLVVLGRAHKTPPELWGGAEDLAPHFRDLLHGLEERDFVLRMPDSAIPGDEEWIFKHNLEREMLAKLVAPEAATDYHLMMAEWLEFRFSDRAEEQLDLLAQHYESGNRPLRAARCMLDSADRARARYANAKAAEHYAKGLQLLGDFDVRLRLDAHHHLGDVLQRLGKVDEAMNEFRSMLGLAFRLDLKNKGGAAHNRIGRLHRDTGHLDLAMKHLGTALALFEGAGDERGVASSFDDIGKVHWMRGNYDQALRYLQDALTRREALGDKRSIALSLNNIGLVFQDSGQYKAALDALTRALELRREVEDLPGVTATLNNLGTIYQDKGDDAEAVQLWHEGLEVAREIGDRKRQAILMLNIGEGQYRMRNIDEAIRMLGDVEQICIELSDRILLAETWRGLGKAHLLRGDLKKAQKFLERSVEMFELPKSKVHVAIARRTLGECLAVYGYDSEQGRRAETLLRQSLEIFEDSGNELEFARTAKVLAELLRQAPETAGSGLADEADQLRLRADEIFSKLQVEEEAVNPSPLYGTETDRMNFGTDTTADNSGLFFAPQFDTAENAAAPNGEDQPDPDAPSV